MQLEGEPVPIRRKVADTNWVLRTLAKEHATIQVPQAWNFDPKGQVVLLEYLYGLFRILESPCLLAFFRYPEPDFLTFKNVPSKGVQAKAGRDRPVPRRPPLPVLP